MKLPTLPGAEGPRDDQEGVEPVLRGGAPARDRTLAAEGWQRRFIGGPPRLGEMLELYAELGYEVRVEPVHDEELADHCAGCRLALTLFRVVYTRKNP
jgi:hypothetical protein